MGLILSVEYVVKQVKEFVKNKPKVASAPAIYRRVSRVEVFSDRLLVLTGQRREEDPNSCS